MGRFARSDSSSDDPAPLIVAYIHDPPADMPIVPAHPFREWISEASDRFPMRCLPLLMGSQSGWFILSGHTFRAVWTGGMDKEAVVIQYLEGAPPYRAHSHFGLGVLTWHLPYLFRTPPGYNLLARGPANWPRDGISPLEGMIETDWAVAPFTMNWKFTRPNTPVLFKKGEPICMIVPCRRGDIEEFTPEIQPIKENPDLQHGFEEWRTNKAAYMEEMQIEGSPASKERWQKFYMRGTSPSGHSGGDQHQVRLAIKPFVSYIDEENKG